MTSGHYQPASETSGNSDPLLHLDNVEKYAVIYDVKRMGGNYIKNVHLNRYDFEYKWVCITVRRNVF